MTDTPPHSQLPPDLAILEPRNPHDPRDPADEAAPRAAQRTSPYRIEQPLRVQWLARRLAGRAGADDAVRQALELDDCMRRLAAMAGQADGPERSDLVGQLTKLRVEFDGVVLAALGEPAGSAPVADIEPDLRIRLAELLGVPLTPEFAPLLELKAAEYLEQGRAFDQVAADFGFAEGSVLGEGEARGALILTHNGSLLQVSAPGVDGDTRARRFVYQNIYGGKMPAEGTLRLTKPVAVGHKVRTKHMETSPVRKLRLAVRPDGWERQRETFRSLSMALSPRPGVSTKTLWGAHPAWHPTVVAKSVQLQRDAKAFKRIEEAGVTARGELREHLLRLADPGHPSSDPVLEADVLGLCMYLQRLRTETGEPGHRLRDVAAFVTDRGERCTVEKHRASVLLTLERPARASLLVPDAGIGEQMLVRGAPVAVVDAGGAIAAVLGDVVWIQPRHAS